METLQQGFADLKENPAATSLIAGSTFRYISGLSFRSFLAIYYAAAFPENMQQFAGYNAFFIFSGLFSTLLGGVLSDKLAEGDPEENPWSKIVTYSTLETIPLQAYCFLSQDNFQLSMIVLAF